MAVADLRPTDEAIELRERVRAFMEAHVYPNEPVLDRLAAQRRADDLDVLACAAERLPPGDAVPALDDLRPGRAEAQ